MRVLFPGFQFAGQTSPPPSCTNFAACNFLISSSAFLPIELLLTSYACRIPSGSTMKVPLRDIPSSSISVLYFHEISWEVSATIGNFIFRIVSEASCQALCVNTVSVDMLRTSAPRLWNSSYLSAISESSVGQMKVKSDG